MGRAPTFLTLPDLTIARLYACVRLAAPVK
jgi:hypothetical protein